MGSDHFLIALRMLWWLPFRQGEPLHSARFPNCCSASAAYRFREGRPPARGAPAERPLARPVLVAGDECPLYQRGCICRRNSLPNRGGDAQMWVGAIPFGPLQARPYLSCARFVFLVLSSILVSLPILLARATFGSNLFMSSSNPTWCLHYHCADHGSKLDSARL